MHVPSGGTQSIRRMCKQANLSPESFVGKTKNMCLCDKRRRAKKAHLIKSGQKSTKSIFRLRVTCLLRVSRLPFHSCSFSSPRSVTRYIGPYICCWVCHGPLLSNNCLKSQYTHIYIALKRQLFHDHLADFVRHPLNSTQKTFPSASTAHNRLQRA